MNHVVYCSSRMISSSAADETRAPVRSSRQSVSGGAVECGWILVEGRTVGAPVIDIRSPPLGIHRLRAGVRPSLRRTAALAHPCSLRSDCSQSSGNPAQPVPHLGPIGDVHGYQPVDYCPAYSKVSLGRRQKVIPHRSEGQVSLARRHPVGYNPRVEEYDQLQLTKERMIDGGVVLFPTGGKILSPSADDPA